MAKTIVLGLDGACWPLLEEWLDSGILPNLAMLRSQATWGSLTSQLPPVTCPNWRCYATGRNPAKLGVFWWEIVNREQRTIRQPSAVDFYTRQLWYELADNGKHVCVINFPTGYPPAAIPNGRFSAGGPGAKDSGFTTPQSWEAELRSRYNYRVHPVDVLHSAEQVARRQDEVLTIMQSRFDVAFDQLERDVDFLHMTLFYINVLQHFCYRGEPTLAGWELIDDNLGRLHKIAKEKEYNLLLMSDHGCAPVDAVFYINTWLADEGFLHLNLRTTRLSVGRVGLNRQRLMGFARRSGLAPFLRRAVPKKVQRAIPNASGTFDKEAKAERIDWENSTALASGQGLIYLLLPPDHPDYEAIRQEIASKLTELTNPITGQPIANQVVKREAVYEGPFLEQAPDLIFEQGLGIHTSGGIGRSQIFAAPQKWAAKNVLAGLFLAWGPDFARNVKVDGTSILDLAPTILHLLEVPIPDDVDGQVLCELLASNSAAAKRPILRRSADEYDKAGLSPEDENEISDRLAALGYLD